jgi:hypothetical protein
VFDGLDALGKPGGGATGTDHAEANKLRGLRHGFKSSKKMSGVGVRAFVSRALSQQIFECRAQVGLFVAVLHDYRSI